MKLSIFLKNILGILTSGLYYSYGWVKHSINGVKINNGSKISPFCNIAAGCIISGTIIARDVTIKHGTYTNTGKIQTACIGMYVSIGPDVLIGLTEHNLDYWTLSPIEARENHIKGSPTDKESKQVVVHDGCWIGAGSIILQGVSIGHKAVVAAGSVVTKNIPPLEVWGGVPARFIKKRL